MSLSRDESSWLSYQRLVLSELERLSAEVASLSDQLVEFKLEVVEQVTEQRTRMQMWSGGIGFAAGIIGYIVVQAAIALFRS